MLSEKALKGGDAYTVEICQLYLSCTNSMTLKIEKANDSTLSFTLSSFYPVNSPFYFISTGKRKKGISFTRRPGSATSAGRNFAARTRTPKRGGQKRLSSADWTLALKRTLPLSRSYVHLLNSSETRSPTTLPHWTSASTSAKLCALSWRPSWRSLM